MNYDDCQYASGQYGCICNCEDALEIFRTDTDLFFVWNDDTGSLRTDTFVCQVFQAGLDKFSDWPAASVYYILPSNSGISSDKLF